MGVYMKKVAFSIEGRRFEVELEDGFADYLEEDLVQNKFVEDRNNGISLLLRAYLKALKQDYDSQNQIKEMISHISTFSV